MKKEKINKLIEKCKDLQKIDLEKSITIAEEILDYSIENNDLESELFSLHTIGKNYFMQNNFQDSIKWLQKIIDRKNDFNSFEIYRDSNRIICDSYIRMGNVINPINYLLKSIEWSKKKNDSLEVAKDQIKLGVMYCRSSNYSESIEQLSLSYDNFSKFDDLRGMNIALLNLGNCYTIIGNYEKGLDYKIKASRYAEKLNDLELMGNCYNSISVLQKQLGDFKNSIESSLKSIKIREKIKLPLALQYNNIGVTYKEWGNIKLCKKYYKKALKYCKNEDDKESLAILLNNTGNLLLAENNIDDALINFEEATEINKEIGDKKNELIVLANIGRIYSDKLNNFKKAKLYFKSALGIADKIENIESIITVSINLVNLYFSNKRIKNAKIILDNISEYIKDVNSYMLKLEFYNCNITYYKLKNNLKKVVEFLELIAQLKEKIFTDENKNKIKELQTKFDIEKKEQEVESYRLKSLELSKKNEEIKKQKVKLEETIEELNKSNLKFNIIEEEFSKSSNEEFVGTSSAIKSILETVSTVSKSYDTNILLTGESGTGKEIIARLIHKLSNRNKKSFYGVNSSAIPMSLFESQFFGHEKNSFTGADKTHIGWFEFANNGTLFLDEIASVPLDQQVKLLRALEERKIVRLGSHKEICVNVRIISATNTDLESLVERNHFRNDLYFRLATFVINIPPLRERKEDIPFLLEHFVKLFSKKLNKPIKRIEKSVETFLMKYNYPGNVRELRNLVERAVILADSATLKYSHFSIPNLISKEDNDLYNEKNSNDKIKTLANIEKEHILKILNKVNFNQTKAAELLDLDRQAVKRKMQKYKIKKIK